MRANLILAVTALCAVPAARALADDPPGGPIEPPPPPPDAAPPTGPGDTTGSDAATTEPEPAPVPAADDVAALRSRVRELEDRVDEVEKHASLQRLEWSGDYRTTLSSFWYHGASPDGNPYGPPVVIDDRNAEQWLHRVRLMIKAEPSKRFRFRGRASVFKRFGSNTVTPSPQDFSEGRIPRDTALRLDRFWLDWFITPEVALSFGRISYSDGSPAELRENLAQPDATWGMTMVDGEYETVDLTFQPSARVLLRGFYASWAFPRNDDLFSSNLFLNSGTDNLRIVGGNADFTVPEAKLFAQVGAYVVPQFRPFSIPIPNPMPPANPGNAPPPLDGSLVFPSSMPDSLGRYANVSLFVMLRDIAGFDVFAGGALGLLDPNGKSIGYPLAPDGSSVPVLQLASADPGASHLTKFFYAGGRFTLPVGATRAPKVGVEFNYGSRYNISFAQPTDTLTNKLANRGNAYEAYLIQPIDERAFVRLDWLYIDTKYTGGFFGAPDPDPASGQPPHGGTAPPVNPTGQTLHALSLTLHANF
jgi:hypothetical protein